MKRLIVGFVLTLSSVSALAQQAECPCTTHLTAVNQIVDRGCIDVVGRTKTALGGGNFYATLHFGFLVGFPRPACVNFISNGGAANECVVQIVDPADENCEGDFEEVEFPGYESSAEQRACIAEQRELAKILESLPPCAQ